MPPDQHVVCRVLPTLPCPLLPVQPSSLPLEASLGLPSKCNPDALGVMQISSPCKDTCHVFLLETGEVRGDVKANM